MRMKHYLKHKITVITCCCGMLISCGEKQQNTGKTEVKKQPEVPAPAELIQHTHNGIKPGDQQAYKITANIYDAPALPLGEIYTTRKQLAGKTARKVAELTNVVNSGHFVKLEKENVTFKTEAIAGEHGAIMDVTAQLKFHDLEMKFSTTLKFGYPAFYEVSMEGNQHRIYVVVISVDKIAPKE